MQFDKIISVFSLAAIALIFNLACNLKVKNEHNTSQPSVEIRQTSDGHIAAAVKDNPSFPATIFVLQMQNQTSLAAPIVLSNASVAYSDNCVTFSSTNGQNVVFKLSNSTCQAPSGNIGVYQGFGLIKQQYGSSYDAAIGTSGNTFPPVTALANCQCNAAGSSASNCTSGGVGSTQCSQTQTNGGGAVGVNINTSSSCTTTCGDGFYACCFID